jgi:two-component system, NtrC family, sensor kinase
VVKGASVKILVADDEAVSRRLLQSYLQKWGHEVVVAGDGAEAWRVFEQGEFPIVITDWLMPEMDGLDLIRRIRGHSERGYVYTILLSAKSKKEDLVEGMEAGADDFLTKPFDRDELRVRLREGERIINLERTLAEQNRTLRQRDRLACLGQIATEIAPELTVRASELAKNFSDLISAADLVAPISPDLASRLTTSINDVKRLRELIRRLSDGDGAPSDETQQ